MATDTATRSVELTWDGVRRGYLVHAPGAPAVSRPLPLVVVLHGGGGSAEFARRLYGWPQLAEQRQFVAVFPEALTEDPGQPPSLRENPRLWNDGSRRSAVARRDVDDVGFLSAVLDDVSTRWPIDIQRVFMTGFSNGGSMTLRAGIELSQRLTAIAPFAGHLCLDDPALARPVSMLYLIGLADPLNPFAGGVIEAPWGTRRTKRPVMDSVRTWVRLIGAPASPALVSAADGVKRLRYGPTGDGAEVQLLTLAGQGHEWPGAPRTLPRVISGPQTRTLDATPTIWEFFQSLHARPDARLTR